MSKFEQNNIPNKINNKENVLTPLMSAIRGALSSRPKPIIDFQHKASQESAIPAPKKSILFESIEPRVLMSADPVLNVSAAIDVPGEVDQYNFNVSSDIKVVFDSLTNDPNLNWSLSGPQGAVIDQRSFAASDAGNLDGSPALGLVAGDYTLSVDGNQDGTGAYQFRLLDLQNATAITPGTAVSGELNPANEMDAYKFDVVQGERFYFELSTNSESSPSWSLLDPNGNSVFQSWSNFEYPMPFADSGTYTLLIEGQISETSTTTYSFSVQPTPEVLFHSIDAYEIVPTDNFDFRATFSEDTEIVNLVVA